MAINLLRKQNHPTIKHRVSYTLKGLFKEKRVKFWDGRFFKFICLKVNLEKIN